MCLEVLWLRTAPVLSCPAGRKGHPQGVVSVSMERKHVRAGSRQGGRREQAEESEEAEPTAGWPGVGLAVPPLPGVSREASPELPSTRPVAQVRSEAIWTDAVPSPLPPALSPQPCVLTSPVTGKTGLGLSPFHLHVLGSRSITPVPSHHHSRVDLTGGFWS
jgi:hypothetical protein